MVNQKRNQEETNPCLKEQELSYKCLSMNNYDKDKCQLEFENYKTCKGFWMSIQSERRRKGIKPYLPTIEDREKIKREYFAKLGK
ncbi:hypothetical protein QE152_g30343 [Popillia japonica]|uniref:Coiled-coil-helix-coiled-coil-helix domain-containing protein 7 n=1 Tax=Popillia japonica TaxID=7064 RepID=A0AAW1JEN2_POPJA